MVTKNITDSIDLLNEWIGRVVSFLVIVITVIVVFEVFMRRVLGSPTIWTFETTKQIYAAHFMLLTPYALLHNAHVSVNIFYQKLRKKTQAVLDILTFLVFFFPFTIIILWKGTMFAHKSWSMLETSWSVFSAPLYYIKTVIPITALLLILQGISIFIKKVHIIMEN